MSRTNTEIFENRWVVGGTSFYVPIRGFESSRAMYSMRPYLNFNLLMVAGRLSF
jgi:hypothetical protein